MQLSAFEDHFGTNACLKSLGAVWCFAVLCCLVLCSVPGSGVLPCVVVGCCALRGVLWVGCLCVLLCPAVLLVGAARCAASLVDLSRSVGRVVVPILPALPWLLCRGALLRVVPFGAVLLCAGLCCLVLLGAAACCVVPSGTVCHPCCVLQRSVVFLCAVCSALCVCCRGVSVRAVVRRCAVRCVCPGVSCCVFPVIPASCGAVLRCAGALALCCFFWSALFLALGAVVLCSSLCCFLWCAVVRCCPALLVAWCAVPLHAVPCSPVSRRVLVRPLASVSPCDAWLTAPLYGAGFCVALLSLGTLLPGVPPLALCFRWCCAVLSCCLVFLVACACWRLFFSKKNLKQIHWRLLKMK